LDERICHRGLGKIWGIDVHNIDTRLALKYVLKSFQNHLIIEMAGKLLNIIIKDMAKKKDAAKSE